MKKYKNTLYSIYLYLGAGFWSFMMAEFESYCIFKIPKSCVLKSFSTLHTIYTSIVILVLFTFLIWGIFIALKKSTRENLAIGITLGVTGITATVLYSWFLYTVLILGNY